MFRHHLRVSTGNTHLLTTSLHAPHLHFTWQQRFLFLVKTRVFITRRILQNVLSPCARSEKRAAIHQPHAVLIAEDQSPLYSHSDPQERGLELGKVQNLRVVARLLDGTIIREHETFSFWQHVGRPSRAKGFVEGRELRQGCLIPSLAGGICQFTNALAKVAHQSGMDIVEQHRHSAEIDNRVRASAYDATVFWNYVDFRFRAPFAVCLSVNLTRDMLVVRLERLP
jgi:hypothetical protein